MADIDWRIWIYNRLRLNTAFSDLVPTTSIYGAGSLTAPPEDKPFIVIKVGDEFYEMPGVTRTLASVWAHDASGSYNLIDSILDTVRNALCGQGETVGQVIDPGGIACKWDSDGTDQADEVLKTLMRRSNYQLLGRNGNG